MAATMIYPKLNFYIATEDRSVERIVRKAGHKVAQKMTDPNIDALILTGGEDISPFLYGEKKLPRTYCNIERDLWEINVVKSFPKHFPKLGICRGAQLLNVLAGGSMYQDVDGHTTGHFMLDLITGEQVYTTSAHHQLMIPATDAVWIAAAKKSTRRESFFGTDLVDIQEDPTDPEVLYYLDMNALCFQGHPEYSSEATESYFWKCVDSYVQFYKPGEVPPSSTPAPVLPAPVAFLPPPEATPATLRM